MAYSKGDPVVTEFQRRRKRMLTNFALTMVLIALGLMMREVADYFPSFLGLSSAGWKALAVAQLLGGVVFAIMGFRQYRCPVCNAIVRAHDKFYLGVAVDPSHCPKCGARLS